MNSFHVIYVSVHAVKHRFSILVMTPLNVEKVPFVPQSCASLSFPDSFPFQLIQLIESVQCIKIEYGFIPNVGK